MRKNEYVRVTPPIVGNPVCQQRGLPRAGLAHDNQGRFLFLQMPAEPIEVSLPSDIYSFSDVSQGFRIRTYTVFPEAGWEVRRRLLLPQAKAGVRSIAAFPRGRWRD